VGYVGIARLAHLAMVGGFAECDSTLDVFNILGFQVG
jgi:hypothetical protein